MSLTGQCPDIAGSTIITPPGVGDNVAHAALLGAPRSPHRTPTILGPGDHTGRQNAAVGSQMCFPPGRFGSPPGEPDSRDLHGQRDERCCSFFAALRHGQNCVAPDDKALGWRRSGLVWSTCSWLR